jgi:hypothetical protein
MDSASVWAREEFGSADLGDARRTRRLVVTGAACARKPAGEVTAVLQGVAAREAAYRFVENPAVLPERIGEAVFAATVRRCAGLASLVVSLDQTSLAFTDRFNAKGLGRTGAKMNPVARGFQVMSALGVGTDGEVVGLLDQQWHVRSLEKAPIYGRDRRPRAERESALWVRSMEAVQQALIRQGSDVRPWFQLDRGGDSNEVLEAGDRLNADLTVRSAIDRRLETGGHLHRTARRAPVLGRMLVTVPTAAGHTRRAILVVRARRVCLRMQAGSRRYRSLEMTVVHVGEAGGRPGRIEWILLTNRPAVSFDAAAATVEAYRLRWRVEEFHRAWKSGLCDVERSQLRSPNALRRWATILAAVATRAERLKTLARTTPEVSALTELSREEVDAAIVLSETKRFRVGTDIPLAEAVELIAHVGGYTGRRNSGGPPGTKVITRGLYDVGVAARTLASVRK